MYSLTGLPPLDMLFNDSLCLFGVHLYISRLIFKPAFKHLDYRLVLADTDASGLRNGNLIGKSRI